MIFPEDSVNVFCSLGDSFDVGKLMIKGTVWVLFYIWVWNRRSVAIVVWATVEILSRLGMN